MAFRIDRQENRDLIEAYAEEAIENHEAGKKIKPQGEPLVIPDPMQQMLDKDPELNRRFNALSLKITPLIQKGVGLHDKYKE